ncbi:MAG: tetratricopeptide repeat protein [Thermogutta sp.]|nr:tetratricopeptide repeat protein [Thermogutta sp.]
MVRRTWLLYLWPGAVPLILEPGWGTFLVAAAFACLFHLCLVATFVWPETWPSLVTRGAWLCLAAGWAYSVYWAVLCDRRQRRAVAPAPGEDLFPAALQAYLRGEWSRTEHILGRLLRRNPRDADALLLLVSLWRRTGRLDQAGRLLRELEKLDAARRWYAEIQREKQLLEEKRDRIAAPDRIAEAENCSSVAPPEGVRLAPPNDVHAAPHDDIQPALPAMRNSTSPAAVKRSHPEDYNHAPPEAAEIEAKSPGSTQPGSDEISSPATHFRREGSTARRDAA